MAANPYESPKAEPKPARPSKRRVCLIEIAIVLFGLAVAGLTIFLAVTTLPP